MEALPTRGIINPEEKQMFRLDVKGNIDDINRKYTTYELKEQISLALKNKDVRLLEVRYNVAKTAEVAKFEENIKNKKAP